MPSFCFPLGLRAAQSRARNPVWSCGLLWSEGGIAGVLNGGGRDCEPEPRPRRTQPHALCRCIAMGRARGRRALQPPEPLPADRAPPPTRLATVALVGPKTPGAACPWAMPKCGPVYEGLSARVCGPRP